MNVTLARYNKKLNMVAERRVLTNITTQEAWDFIQAHFSKPLYAWVEGGVNTGFPHSVITVAYRDEYKKIID